MRSAPEGAVAFVRGRLVAIGCATESPDAYWCPCHDSRGPSLRVVPARASGDEGLASIVCSAGCAPADVLRALGLRVMRPLDPDLPAHLSVVIPLAVDAGV